MFKNWSADIASICVSIVFILLPFAFADITEDPELQLRYLLLSISLTVFSFILIFKKQLLFSNLRNPIFSGYLILVFIIAVGISGSINKGEAIYIVCKLLTGLFYFMLLSSFIQKKNNLAELVSVLISISVLIFTLFAIPQLVELIIQSQNSGNEFTITNYLSSTLSNKNFFAETLLLSLPFCFYNIFKQLRRIRLLGIISSAVALILILLLQSAAVYAGLAVMLTVILFFSFVYRTQFAAGSYRRLFRIKNLLIVSSAVFVIGLTFIIVLLNSPGNNQFEKKWSAIKLYITAPEKILTNSPLNSNSVHDRILLARNSFKMFKEHPLIGNGTGNWRIIFPKYGFNNNYFFGTGKIRFEHPHNDYLLLLTENGIAGLICWLFILIAGIYCCIKLIHKVDAKEKILFLLIAAAIISFMTVSLFSYPRERFFSMILLLTCLAIISAYQNSVHQYNSLKKINLVMLPCIILVTVVQLINYRSAYYFHKSLKYKMAGNFGGVERMANKSQSFFHPLDATGTPVSWYIGQAAYWQGDTAEALRQYKVAAQQNPLHIQVLNDLAAVYESRGEHEKALHLLNKVLSISPQFDEALLNLIAVHFNSGKVDIAYKELVSFPHKHLRKWTENAKMILLIKAQNHVRATRDTILMNNINKHLMRNNRFLVNVFEKSVKEKIPFEEELNKLN
jgi:O-antigen ligase